MGQSKVIALSKYVSADRLAELRQGGVSVDKDQILSTLSLPEPAYGEEIVGEVTEDELFIFAELFELKNQLEAAGRELVGGQLSKMGDTIRTSDASKPLQDVLENSNIMEKAPDDQVKAYFTLQQRVAMLHSTLHFFLGERFDSHHYRMGVRSRGRVVRIERR